MLAARQLQKFSLISRASRRFTSLATRPCLSTAVDAMLDTKRATASVSVGPRAFSSFSSSSSSPTIPRSFPQYNVHGVTCMLSVKVIAPSFRLVRGEYLAVEQNKRGRFLLEFTPRGSDGSYVWQDQIRFGLSPEEVGLICCQLPESSVELCRMPSSYDRSGGDSPTYGSHDTSDMPDKVLRVEPGQAATVQFSIDYVKDGIGGQPPGLGQEGKGGPLDIIVQAGEFRVISKLMDQSIPYLVGWKTLIEFSLQRSADEAKSGDGNSGGSVPF